MTLRNLGSEQNQPATESILDKEAWRQAVEEAVAEAKTLNSPLAIIFIDVNDFKDINDTLGHAIGDEVIKEVRDLLANNLRLTEKRVGQDRDLLSVSESQEPKLSGVKGDIEIEAGRIGGDEFGILCKADDKGALVIVERLRNVFADYMKSKAGTKLGDLDISLAIGVSVLQPGMSVSKLLEAADQDMYNDKLSQLPPLSHEQQKFLLQLEEGLDEYDLRLRDIGKYLIMLSRKAES